MSRERERERERVEGYANERKVLKILNELQLIIRSQAHSTLSTTMMSRNDYF